MGIEFIHKEAVHFEKPHHPQARVNILRSAYEIWGSGTLAYRPTVNRISLLVIESGHLQFQSLMGNHEMMAGDVVWVCPGTWHEFSGLGSHQLSTYVFDFQLPVQSAPVSQLIPTLTGWKQHHENELPLKLAESLHVVASLDQSSRQEIANHLLIALLELLFPAPSKEPLETPDSKLLYERCQRYMERHFEDLTYPNEVSEQLGLSVEYMCRLFQKYSQTTPGAYLLQLKMNYAAHQLKSSNISISELAKQLNYANPFSFSKCFKKTLGLSPKHYRDQS